MRKLFVLALAALALVVVINISTRTGRASFDLESVSPWFGRHDGIAAAVAALVRPGTCALWYLGFNPDKSWELVVAALTSWWAWLTAARLLWYNVGRAFGIAGLRDFHWWLRFALPWRPPYRVWLRIIGWWRQFRYGSRATAAWTGTLAAMTLVFRPGDCVFVGRLWIGGVGFLQAIGLRGPRHFTIVGGSGAGKTRYLKAILGMLHKEASACIVDCAAEMINALGSYLERAGHKIINLDPFGLSNFPRACWNTISELDRAEVRHGRQAVVRFALKISQALIIEDNSHQPVFANAARSFIHGLVLYVWLFEPPERRSLVRMRELLAQGLPEQVIDPKQDPFDALLSFMMRASTLKDDGCEGKITDVIARAASVMRSGKGRDGNPFRTTALSQTTWLDLPEIAAISQSSDFACEDLKLSNPCVFICAPLTDIQNSLSGWVRMLAMVTMYTFENMPGRMKIPCSFILDEMPSLRIELLDTAAPGFRKYGIRLIVITQDNEKLQQAYPKSWEGFYGNAMCTILMSSDHQSTLEYFSKVLANYTHTERIEGGNWLMRLLGISKVPARYQRVDRPLMPAHQMREFLDPDRGQVIVIRTGKRPLHLAYEGFDRALPVWAYDSDPSFREPRLRAFTRMVLAWLWLRKLPLGAANPKRAEGRTPQWN